MNYDRAAIAKIIGIDLNTHLSISYIEKESVKEDGYTRKLIELESEKEKIIAYLLLPDILNHNPAVLINHQHNGQRHLGKSEVCGLEGNPLQAFAPALARIGFVVLAPDSICFEERRKGGIKTTPLENDGDFLQHYNEFCYRILKGETLMEKVLRDAMDCITLLSGLPFINPNSISTLGHSYGGSTALFLAALDERVQFVCASGCACTYKNRMENNVGIEMASVIPDFINHYDIDDLISVIAPKKLLIVSAKEDKYSKDATYIVDRGKAVYEKYQLAENLYHYHYSGGHALTKQRFSDIVAWLKKVAL